MRAQRNTERGCLEYKEDDESYHEAKEARRFGKREAEKQVRELAWGGGRIAECAGKEVAEDVAYAKACADESEASKACTNHFSCCDIHEILQLVRKSCS
jgi:hypothetical protein